MNADQPSGFRIVVIGTSSAGKSDLAVRLAGILDVPRIELDELFWDRNWTPQPTSEFVRLVETATSGSNWVVDGNYGVVRDRIWPKATHIVWLNYGLPLVLWRGLKRSVGRILSGRELWHGNRESFRRTFMSRKSILVWILTTHRRRTREFEALRHSEEYLSARWVACTRPARAERWLQRVSEEGVLREPACPGSG
jgi:adenylate kinase family enzyme